MVRKIRHGSSISSSSSSPTAHCTALTRLLLLVGVRDDAAAGFVLDVEVAPLAAGQLVEQVLPRAVGGDRDRVAEQHGAGVGGEVRVGVEVLGDLARLRAHRVPVVAAVGVVLQVGHVRPVAFQIFIVSSVVEIVARRAEVVAVQVHRVRQAQFVDDLRQAAR